MTLLRTYRPARRNPELGFDKASELYNRFFNDERRDCNQFFAVPPANIIEGQEDYRIDIAIPGFEKSDFDIELNEDLLTISLGKDDNQEKHKDEENSYVMREFNFNTFKRSFKISENIDRDKIEATYKDGILELRLPIKEEVLKNTNRSIEVE
jgi:HSP20 family protein